MGDYRYILLIGMMITLEESIYVSMDLHSTFGLLKRDPGLDIDGQVNLWGSARAPVK